MAFDSLVRIKQVNKPEFSGYVVDVLLQYLKTGTITGLAMNTGALTGVFYPLSSNPAGYVTSSALADYVTTIDLSVNTTFVLSAVEESYYPRSNPSGYITSGQVPTGYISGTGITNLIGVGGIVVTGIGVNTYVSGSGFQALTGFVKYSDVTKGSYTLFSHLGLFDLSMASAMFWFDAANTGFYLVGRHAAYPSERYVIDLAGTHGSDFGLSYTKPTIHGFEIDSRNLSVSGVRVPTINDLTGYATTNQLITTSGLLYNQISWAYSSLLALITGSYGSSTISVSGVARTGVVPFSGASGIVVAAGPNNSVIFGISSTGFGVSGLIVTGKSLMGRIPFSGRSGILVTTTGDDGNTLLLTFSSGKQLVDLTSAQTIKGTKYFTGYFRADEMRGYSPHSKSSINMKDSFISYDDNERLNWSGMYLLDSWYTTSLRWNDRTLLDTTSNVSVHWGNRYLEDSNEITSLDWNARLMYDTITARTIDWGNRYLYRDNSTVVMDWYKREHYGPWSAEHFVISGYRVATTRDLTGVGAGGIQAFSVFLPSGLSSPTGILFPTGYGLVPKVNVQFINDVDQFIYTSVVTGITATGFYVVFSDDLSSGGYKLSVLAVP